MNTKNLPVLTALMLGAFGAASAAAMVDDAAPKPGRPALKPMTHDPDHLMTANEPHHLLAMAYHQNLMTFAKALHEQTAQATTVEVEFARTAEKEMRHSFAEMKRHHADLVTLLAALEKEVNQAQPDLNTVSTLAADIHTHCLAMENLEPVQ
jgi:hypothetical protein